MKRWTKLIAPLASLALILGFHQANLRADDAAAPAGKATVVVTVVDSAGKPVSGAEVGIYPAKPKKAAAAAAADATTQPADATGKKAKPVAMVSGETAADGTVSLAKVPNGKFAVQVRLKGAGTGKANVTIADDKDGAVTVTLAAKAGKAAKN
jgi:hypothetical protein